MLRRRRCFLRERKRAFQIKFDYIGFLPLIGCQCDHWGLHVASREACGELWGAKLKFEA